MFKNTLYFSTIVLSLLFAAGGSGCDSHAAVIAAAALPASAASVAELAPQPSFDIAPQPPFDQTPITPVESVGASRSE